MHAQLLQKASSSVSHTHCSRAERGAAAAAATAVAAFARRRRGRGRRGAAVTVRADVGEAARGGLMDAAFTWGAIGLSLGATAVSLLHEWPRRQGHHDGASASAPAVASASSTLQRPQPQQEPEPLTEPDQNFTWAVMGVVSCIPLFNSMAWVLGALQSASPRPFYWAAALYAAPLLRNGFDQDWFSVTMLLLGAAHLQALRVGATEPETQAQLRGRLRPRVVAGAVAGTAGRAVAAAVGQGPAAVVLPSLGAGGARTPVPGRGDDAGDGKGNGDGGGDGGAAALARLELDDFDRRLSELEAARPALRRRGPQGDAARRRLREEEEE